MVHLLQVDRSPCGSGTCARTALQYFRGQLQVDQSRTFKNRIGLNFKAKPVKPLTYGGYDAVVVELSGQGFYTGSSTFTMEKGDPIGTGFLLA